MKTLLGNLLLILVIAFTPGCWDTVTTMTPGDSVELDAMTFGDDYIVEGCTLRREEPASETVLISASSLSIFSEFENDSIAARKKYLNTTVRVTGRVTDITNYDHILADTVEITFGEDKAVTCELGTNITHLELLNLVGTTQTLEGKIERHLWRSIWLYDCRILKQGE